MTRRSFLRTCLAAAAAMVMPAVAAVGVDPHPVAIADLTDVMLDEIGEVTLTNLLSDEKQLAALREVMTYDRCLPQS